MLSFSWSLTLTLRVRVRLQLKESIQEHSVLFWIRVFDGANGNWKGKARRENGDIPGSRNYLLCTPYRLNAQRIDVMVMVASFSDSEFMSISRRPCECPKVLSESRTKFRIAGPAQRRKGKKHSTRHRTGTASFSRFVQSLESQKKKTLYYITKLKIAP